MAFLQNSKIPEPFREGIAIALHGSWNRRRMTGYKVIFFPWQGGRPGRQIDLVTGWLDDQSQSQWGRPVDVKPANDGSLLISDDYSGTIYRLAPLQNRQCHSAGSESAEQNPKARVNFRICRHD